MKNIESKEDKDMCRHKHVVFLGKQELPWGDEQDFIALFNCQDCHSTVSVKMRKGGYRGKGLSRSA